MRQAININIIEKTYGHFKLKKGNKCVEYLLPIIKVNQSILVVALHS